MTCVVYGMLLTSRCSSNSGMSGGDEAAKAFSDQADPWTADFDSPEGRGADNAASGLGGNQDAGESGNHSSGDEDEY